MAGLPPLLPTPPAAMARLPPLLPTPPASLKLQGTDAVESSAPKRNRPLEPPASDSRRREPNSQPPSKGRHRSRSPSPYKFGRRSRSPPYKVRRRSRSPPPSKVRRRSRSPPPSEVRRRSRSPSPSPSKVWRRSRSPPPYKVGCQSRSPLSSKVYCRSRSPLSSEVRRRSRSPSPYKVRRRSRSPSPSKVRRRSRSPLPSKCRRRSRSPPPYKVGRRSRSPSPYKVRRRSRSRSPSKVRRRSRSRSPSKVRRRSRSPSKVWRRSRSPLPSKVRRRSRSPLSSKEKRRSRSPPYVSVTQRLTEVQHAKQPSAEAAVKGERWRPSSLHESLVENSNCSCKHPETSSAAVEKRPDPVIQGDERDLQSEKMDGKNQSDDKAPSRNARRKKMKRQKLAEAKKEDPSRHGRRKKMTRQIWGEAKKEFREMKKDKLLENIKKLQACVWLLEKDGADMAEIMEFRSLLESTKKQYAENEAQLAKGRSGAPLQLLNRERREKTHVETVAAPVEKVEGDEQNMDSGKVEGRSLKGCEAVSDENELAEELNRLKSELETVRQDRDDQLAQAQSLMADIAKQKEVARRYGVELEDAMRRVAALEEGCLLRRKTIKALQIQLASANEKLTVPSPTRD